MQTAMNTTPDFKNINDIMLDRLTHVKRAVVTLKRDGYSVIGMDMEHARPVLKIQNCARCQKLIDAGRAVFYRWQTVDGVREKIAQFELEGCKVIWTERGH